MHCRVCGNSTLARIFHSAPRSIVAISRPVDVAVNVYACEQCGHAQSDDIDYAQFYDRDYRFHLESPDHDELHAVVDGKKIYRTDLQADVSVDYMSLPRSARILDYGAAKGTTLRKICKRRPDLIPCLFDVSDVYVPSWDEWLARERQATYSTPSSWAGSFDAVLNFFVLEHVARPDDVMRKISDLLAPGGICMVAVPNPLENYSDFVVVEHVSHFTQSSLAALLRQNSCEIERYSGREIFGAHIVVARKQLGTNAKIPDVDVQATNTSLKSVAAFWSKAQSRLRDVAQRNPGRPCAIYGASVYGCYIATRLEGIENVRCFVDRNPQLWGMSEFGVPVVGPDNLPDDVDLVYAGVNPLKARDILADVPEWRGRSIETVFLSDS